MLAEGPTHTPECPLMSTQPPVKHPELHILLTVLKRGQSTRIDALHGRDGGKNARVHTLSHTHTCIPEPRRFCTSSGPILPSASECSGPCADRKPSSLPPPRPLGGKQEGGRVGRLPQGGAPGRTCRAPTLGPTPCSTSSAGSGGSGPQQDGHRHHGLRAQPEYQPRQGLRGAFQFTAGQTEAPEGTTQGLRAAVLAREDEPRPAQSPSPAAAPRERQGHVPWSYRVASDGDRGFTASFMQ